MEHQISERNLHVSLKFLRTARIEPERLRTSLDRAKAVLKNARSLEGRIQDPVEWLGVHKLADELERAIASFSI